MKNSMGFVLGFLAYSLSAPAANLPAYLGEVKGVALSGLTTSDDFEFHPGTVGSCSQSGVPELVSFSCDVTGAQAVVHGANGKTITVNFTKVVAQSVSPHLSPQYRRFVFNGDWSNATDKANYHSAVRLELWHYLTDPQDIHGSFALSNYGVSGSVQATQAGR